LALLLVAGCLVVWGGAAGGESDKTAQGPAEDDSVREVGLLLESPGKAVVKVITAGAGRGARPVEIRQCVQSAKGELRLVIRLWDQQEHRLQARLPAGWAPAEAGVEIVVVVDKAPRLATGDKLNSVLLENQLWPVVATETVVKKEDIKE
jgi:hypothetical protein